MPCECLSIFIITLLLGKGGGRKNPQFWTQIHNPLWNATDPRTFIKRITRYILWFLIRWYQSPYEFRSRTHPVWISCKLSWTRIETLLWYKLFAVRFLTISSRNWLTLTPKTCFTQFYLKFNFYTFSPRAKTNMWHWEWGCYENTFK